MSDHPPPGDTPSAANPYAPPQHDGAAPMSGAAGRGAGSFELAPSDWTIVFSLTRWMRALFGLQIAAALLIGVAMAAVSLTGAFKLPAFAQYARTLPLLVALVLVMIAYLIVGSIFLRRSAHQIHQGTVDGVPRMLATGFRSLRVYLVIIALYELTSLGSNVYSAIVGR